MPPGAHRSSRETTTGRKGRGTLRQGDQELRTAPRASKLQEVKWGQGGRYRISTLQGFTTAGWPETYIYIEDRETLGPNIVWRKRISGRQDPMAKNVKRALREAKDVLIQIEVDTPSDHSC